VGVARQYSGTLGKVGACQVAVTAAFWTGTHGWLLGARLYLPKNWLTAAQRVLGRTPDKVVLPRLRGLIDRAGGYLSGGKSSGATSSSMLRATLGRRWIKPRSVRVTIIRWAVGGVTRK